MDSSEIDLLLDVVRAQSYPLEITEACAEAMVVCIQRVMDFVPECDRVLVRGEYDAVTSALLHPTPTFGVGENDF